MSQVLGYLVLAGVVALITVWLRRDAKRDLSLPLTDRIERTRLVIDSEPQPKPLKFERAERKQVQA